MRITDLLKNILKKAERPSYLERFDEKYDNLSELFIEPIDIDTITDQPILLLSDRKPHSLISMAYALRFASDLECKIFIISEGIHDTILEEEAEELGVPIEILLTDEEYTLDDIEELIDLIDIGFIVVNVRNRLTTDLIELSPIPVYVTKIP